MTDFVYKNKPFRKPRKEREVDRDEEQVPLVETSSGFDLSPEPPKAPPTTTRRKDRGVADAPNPLANKPLPRPIDAERDATIAVRAEAYLHPKPGQLPALETWLKLNEDAFASWPGLNKMTWTLAGFEGAVKLTFDYASRDDMDACAERWDAAWRLTQHVLAKVPRDPQIVSATGMV
mmetsp:Transcript_26658/g.79945  ORF Transcript_26658/g.79945 Transcript_26658/m.79945 type:complete len:177 (+) Transcript_26658:491-1021(+)